MHNLLLAALFLPVWLGSPADFQDGSTIDPDPGSISFQGGGRFTARVQSSEPLRDSRLILESGSSRYVFQATVGESTVGYTLIVDDLKLDNSFFPFTKVNYWWEVDFQSGDGLVSITQTFQYSDDRFSWNQQADRRVFIAWVEGDDEAARDAVDLALLALGTISADLETPIPERIALYIYPRMADLQSAMGDRLNGWEGAVSDPDSGIILLAAAPGAEGRQTLAILVPHEIAHLLLAAKWKSGYASLPLWLVEGVAAGYEMEPRPEADRKLQDAEGGGSLIPIQTLCGIFPAEEGPALLAYAQSKSFVAFLSETYGLEVLRRGLAAYAGGADCSGGLEASTGKSLGELEAGWRSWLTQDKPWIPTSWILVLAGFILLSGLLIIQMLIRRGKRRLSKGKEGTG